MNYLAMLLQGSADGMQQQVQQTMMMMIPIFMVAGIICLAVILIPFWFICKKAGFSPWLTLLNLVPLGGLVLMYVLAFADWNVVPVPQAAWQPFQPSTPQPPQLPPQA